LDSSLLNEARKLFADLTELSSVRIPRCLRVPDELSVMSVHVFADASADAYASVVYTKCEYVLGHISCHFVCAKTKLAPLTSTSIRRLELMAAVLAVQMSVSVVKVLEIPVTKVHFWTDSMNVLFWIRNQSRIFKPFVANRIGEIHRLTDQTSGAMFPRNVILPILHCEAHRFRYLC